MSTNSSPEMTLEAIRSVPLFASLDDNATRELRNLLRRHRVSAGSALFRAGDQGDAMYLIEKGRVRISITDDDKKEITLAELAQGDFFGETFSRLRRTDKMLQQRVSRNVNEEEDKRMTLANRAADLLAEFGGSWKFIGVAIALIIFWIVLNSYILIRGFDPVPYQMLNIVLAVVAGLQAPIIMMLQNRQGAKDRLRADLDFQVNLKNELALTEVLRRLDVLESERLPLLFEKQNERLTEAKVTMASAGTTPN